MPSTMGIVASSIWTPAALTPWAWFDGADASTFTYSSGVIISAWNDKSGNARHLTPATANAPTRDGTLGGVTTVKCAGDADRGLKRTVTFPAEPYTHLMTGSVSGTNTYQTLVGVGNGATERSRTSYWGTTLTLAYSPSGATNTISQGWGTNASHSVVTKWNGAASTLYIDNLYSNTVTQAPASGDAIYVGTSCIAEYWQGAIGEIVFVDRVLTTAEMNSWWAYSKRKWGSP